MATFVLQGTAATVVTPNATTGPVLKIATPDAAPAYASSRMAYIEQPYRVDYSRGTVGRSAVADAETLLTQRLSNSRLFRFVFADSAGVDEALASTPS